MDCVFCRIARGEIPARTVFQDEHLIAFDDIHPAAPVHVLIVPRKHISSLAGASEEDVLLLGRMLLAARDVARARGIEDKGYRVVANTGEHGGQEVFHCHLHVLGGMPLGRILPPR
ncbi:MAG: histidine triad nucleotide-binding protein [Planctomycetes bacterium]|nr:histidine triad nucleotide-binding protein [Planctomycetota bacterium]